MTDAGRMASTKRFFSRTISSPAGDRRPSRMDRAPCGHSSHRNGRTMASV
jgi:hypothetical protein